MASSALIKRILRKSLAESVYNDIVTKTSNYYYYLGRTLSWADDSSVPYPVDSYSYERDSRNNIIGMKQIGPSDACFVIPRINWVTNTVYDMYDDQYSTEIIGINIVDGGSKYTSLPTITITGGGGSGAKFYPIIKDNQIVGVEEVGVLDTSKGYGYTSTPIVTVTPAPGDTGSGAKLEAVVNIAPSSKSQQLETTNFYVVTDDYNVYKCLDNNNGAVSTVKPISTSLDPFSDPADGYVWKYMYTIPVNLRTKFMDSNYIPVTTALSQQFYTNGSLNSVIINNKGVGYTSAVLSITGDGYLESNPYYITRIDVKNGGTGYVSPTIAIDPPFTGGALFVPGSQVIPGELIYTENQDYYKVLTQGILGDIEPTHTFGSVLNDSLSPALLQYVGSTAKGTLVTQGGIIQSVLLSGGVRQVDVASGGTGYSSNIKVSFVGDGTGAAGIAKVDQTTGSILYVTVTSVGSGYTTEPDVVFGEEWAAETNYVEGDQVFYNTHLYNVLTSGTTSTTPPTTTTGSQTNGTCVLEMVGTVATASSKLIYGYGYSSKPAVTITDSEHSGTVAQLDVVYQKSQARLTPIISNGQIVDVMVLDGGVGYSYANIEVSGDGVGASLSANLDVGNINSQQANTEILAVNGSINAIAIVSGGYGYGQAVVTVEGDGSGATASAVIDTNNVIRKINITNPGSGYTYANVVITGNGFGAKARAIISPYGGHGKNAPDELFATTLMFHTNISSELNQGVSVSNDYRQVGIIKNPNKYSDFVKFEDKIGSACFLVQGSTDFAGSFVKDNIAYIHSSEYIIIASSYNYLLLQPINNGVPQNGDTVLSSNNPGTAQTFSVTGVVSPQVDKYSGQLMYIDNNAAFLPSPEETITLRTIIQF